MHKERDGCWEEEFWKKIHRSTSVRRSFYCSGEESCLESTWCVCFPGGRKECNIYFVYRKDDGLRYTNVATCRLLWKREEKVSTCNTEKILMVKRLKLSNAEKDLCCQEPNHIFFWTKTPGSVCRYWSFNCEYVTHIYIWLCIDIYR